MTDPASSVKPFIDAVASRQSTPGGGAVAAVVGAQAAALISMVAEFSDKSMQPLATQAKAAADHFIELGVADGNGFRKVMAAYGLPRSDPSRVAAVQQSLLEAMSAPRQMLTQAIALAELLPALVEHGNKNLISDTAMVALLLDTTLATAELNVRINLKSVTDDAVITEVKLELELAAGTRTKLQTIAAETANLVD